MFFFSRRASSRECIPGSSYFGTQTHPCHPPARLFPPPPASKALPCVCCHSAPLVRSFLSSSLHLLFRSPADCYSPLLVPRHASALFQSMRGSQHVQAVSLEPTSPQHPAFLLLVVSSTLALSTRLAFSCLARRSPPPPPPKKRRSAFLLFFSFLYLPAHLSFHSTSTLACIISFRPPFSPFLHRSHRLLRGFPLLVLLAPHRSSPPGRFFHVMRWGRGGTWSVTVGARTHLYKLPPFFCDLFLPSYMHSRYP